MKVVYKHNDNVKKDYQSIQLYIDEFVRLAQNKVKNALIDEPQRDLLSQSLKSLEQETGFKFFETLLLDMQAFSNTVVNVCDFRIGKALE